MAKRRIRLPRLSRGWRIVRNLAVALACLYALWARAGWPLPTPELEFRRLERENLLGRSEIQGIWEKNNINRIVFGTQGDQVLVSRYNIRTLESWPKEKSGATLFPASELNPYPGELLFAAADLPAGTASARLDMTIDCWFATDGESGTRISGLQGGRPRDDSLNWNQWTRDYRAEGKLLKEGGVLFRVPRGDADGTVSIERDLFSMLTQWNTYLYQPAERRGVNCRMEAVFYGADGAELGRAALSTPEDGDSAAG